MYLSEQKFTLRRKGLRLQLFFSVIAAVFFIIFLVPENVFLEICVQIYLI